MKSSNLNAHLILALSALFLTTSASATTVENSVDYGFIHGYIQFNNPVITSVSNGSIAGNVANVSAGSSITLTADWNVVATNYDYCPYCIIEEYVAWIGNAGTNGASPLNQGLAIFGYGETPSGSFSWTTSAPTIAGSYFIGAGSSLDYSFQPWVGGSTGTGVISGLGDVASFQVNVSSVPLPASVWMFGSALMALMPRRIKRHLAA